MAVKTAIAQEKRAIASIELLVFGKCVEFGLVAVIMRCLKSVTLTLIRTKEE